MIRALTPVSAVVTAQGTGGEAEVCIARNHVVGSGTAHRAVVEVGVLVGPRAER
jgi:hypothetical protein